MSAFLETIVSRAKSNKKTIVLAEGDDERTLKAAERILADNVANLIIAGEVGEGDTVRVDVGPDDRLYAIRA